MERPTENAVVEFGDYETKLKQLITLLTPEELIIFYCRARGFPVIKIAQLWEVDRREIQHVLVDIKNKAKTVYGEEATGNRTITKKKFPAF